MKFLKKMLSYGIANTLSKFITFLILPIYTRWLLPDDYGQADLAYTMAGLLVSLVFMEIWVGLLRFVTDANKDDSQIKYTYSTIVLISLGLFLPYCVFQSIAGLFIGTQYTVFACLYGISLFLKNTEQYFARSRGQTTIFIVSGLITSFFQLVFAYILVRFLKMNANVVLLAPAIGNFLAILYMQIVGRNYNYFSFRAFEKQLARNVIVFSAPLSVNSLAFWAMNNINKFFAAYFLGYSASSYITIAAKLTLALSLITTVFTLAWQEFTFESSNEETRGLKYREMSKAYLYIFTSGTIAFMMAIAIIFPYYIGKKFHDSYTIIPLYFVSVYFAGLSAFFGTIFGAEKITNKLMFTTIAGTVSNIVLVLLTIHRFGLIVIPICAGIGNLICMSARYIIIQKKFDLGINIFDVLCVWLLLAVAVIIAYQIKGTFALIAATIGITLILLLICYIVLVKRTGILKAILKKY